MWYSNNSLHIIPQNMLWSYLSTLEIYRFINLLRIIIIEQGMISLPKKLSINNNGLLPIWQEPVLVENSKIYFNCIGNIGH